MTMRPRDDKDRGDRKVRAPQRSIRGGPRAPAPPRTARETTSAPDEGRRRSLSALQPPTQQSGDQAVAEVLFEALVLASEDDADTLTHGFHSYPARLHPSIASLLIDRFADPSSRIVDPFCGSGTVLIEARRRGLPSWGVDLNPVALRVAEVKAEVRTPASLALFAGALEEVVERSKERVRDKAESRAPLTKEQADRFEHHVLRELGGLWKEIGGVNDEADRRAMFVVLSAILVKVSKQRADTDVRDRGAAPTAQGRRMGRFIPTEIFHKKGKELIERWESLAFAAKDGPAPRLSLDDARSLPRILTKPATLIVTSPPYAGTYDYAEHHALRAPWLGVTLEGIQRGEIGARRSLVAAGAAARWDEQVLEVLRALGGALDAKGLAVLIVGDGQLGGTRVPAEEQLARLAPAAKLRVIATASAPRLDWRGGADRREHLVALAH